MSRCQWGLRRLAGLGCFWLAAAWATPARSADCGRTCLEGFAQRYLSALASHDPSLLVWAPRSHFSENGVFLHPGEALWGTVSSVDPVRDFAVDVADGGISFTVPVREGQRPALLAARLRVVRNAILELETVVARKETSSFLVAQVPPIEETTGGGAAAAMIGAANAYLAAIVDRAAPVPPLSKHCQRIENGVQTTNNPDPLPGVATSPLRADVTNLDCGEQFRRGLLKFITRVRDVRFPVVDRERGIVSAWLLFDHDGRPVPEKPGGRALSSGLPSPFSFVVSERFQMEPDGIGRITAVITQVPFGIAGLPWPAAASIVSK